MSGQVVNLAERVAQLEAEMLEFPQANCPVVHRFADGLYIREVSIPAGVFAIGHAQKQRHLCIMVKGSVLMVGPDGERKRFDAPLTYVCEPGRKVGYVIEDMTWLNVYATDVRDIETLEATLLEKSGVYRAASERLERLTFDHAADQIDFADALADLGVTAAGVAEASRATGDLVDFPPGEYRVRVARSPIEGKGLFATAPIAVGEVIAPGRLDGKRTPAGRYVNHGATPNAAVQARAGTNDLDFVALRPIAGSRGGELGEEITVDYRQARRASSPAVIDVSTIGLFDEPPEAA